MERTACRHMTKSLLPSHARPGAAWAGTDGQNAVPFGDTHGCTKCHRKTLRSFQKHAVALVRTHANASAVRAGHEEAPPRAPHGGLLRAAHLCHPRTLTLPGTLQALERHSFRVIEYRKCFLFEAFAKLFASFHPYSLARGNSENRVTAKPEERKERRTTDMQSPPQPTDQAPLPGKSRALLSGPLLGATPSLAGIRCVPQNKKAGPALLPSEDVMGMRTVACHLQAICSASQVTLAAANLGSGSPPGLGAG